MMQDHFGLEHDIVVLMAWAQKPLLKEYAGVLSGNIDKERESSKLMEETCDTD